MDIDGWVEQPEEEEVPQLLAVDTNVLLSRLALVQALHKRLLASNVWLFVPHVVVRGTSARSRVQGGALTRRAGPPEGKWARRPAARGAERERVAAGRAAARAPYADTGAPRVAGRVP